MMHVGDILSTVGDVQYGEGDHDKCVRLCLTLIPWNSLIYTILKP